MKEGRDALIVLVDDDEDFLEIGRVILSKKGYSVLCFSDTEKAFEEMKKRKPDIVITDLMMESLHSGFSLSQRIKEDPFLSDVPVIIVTAISKYQGFDFSPQTDADLKAMHADFYFSKPVKPEKLLAKVEELLHRNCKEGDPE
ncbi:MAG: response regulator [Planctomycetota bacterium]|nr:response regulator [Planctomycetota bacterium]